MTRSLPLIVVAVALLSPAPATAARYHGLTEQNQPVSLRHDTRTDKLFFNIGFIPDCLGTGGESEGEQFFTSPERAKVPRNKVLRVRANGRFSKTFRLTRDESTGRGNNRSTFHRETRLDIAGRLMGGGTAEGTIRVRYDQRSVQVSEDETLEFESRCDSGERDWSTPDFTFTGPWRPTGPIPRTHAPSILLRLRDGRVLSAGGQDNGKATPGAALWSRRSDRWTRIQRMISSRDNAAAALMENGRVLVAGGYRAYNAGSALRSAEIFNPSTRRWKAAKRMDTPRQGAAMALLPDGRLLVAGGFRGSSNIDGNTSTASTEIYNPQTGKWSDGAPLPFALANLEAATLPSGKILVAGGRPPSGSPDHSLMSSVYDPAAGTWSAIEEVENLGRLSDLVTLADGRVFTVGGFNPDPVAAVYSEGFGWAPAAPPPAFPEAGAARLPSGKVMATLAVGGNFSFQGGIYDPATDSWALAPLYFTPFYRTISAKLISAPSGVLLVDDGPDAYTRAERFYEE